MLLMTVLKFPLAGKTKKMMQKAVFVALLVFVSADDSPKNTKRSIGSFGYPWNTLLGSSWISHYPWHHIPAAHGLFYPHPITTKSHFSLGPHDIAAAVAAAKEATAAAALAHQKVQAAREQVIIQERIAAAKEAAAHAAIQRSEAAAQIAAAIQKSEALAAAAAAVHKSAGASTAVAHGTGHYSATGPWIPIKPGYNHWG